MSFRAALILAAVSCAPVSAADPDSTQTEFFEKSIRPLLVDHCYRCHSADAKDLKGGLRVDSREALLEGGETGKVLVPGQPEKSRLIEAVTYKNSELQMPPKAKLPDAAIGNLTRWVKDGAYWPEGGKTKEVKKSDFDLQKRKREHWAWAPIRTDQPVPQCNDSIWPRTNIDRFLFAKMQAAGVSPAADADRATLLRRVYFDLIGLPPKPAEMDAFLKDHSEKALETVVDRLLASEAYGERWGRHWLDLVRFAESRGHEFDPNIPNAWQYRDYVIRALNVDVPYNQFVLEHLAGDLLPEPRLHPQEKFNESILGTGFWFLGEEVHSPVDIRGDQADRFDNRIDVFGKTFLGLTIACARCHDHKFDAISTKDYYSLYGFLESSSYRLVRFDSIENNRKIARELQKLRDDSRRQLQKELATNWLPQVEKATGYLLAARDYLRTEKAFAEPEELKKLAAKYSVEPARIPLWAERLRQAAKKETDPLHAFAHLALSTKPDAEALAGLKVTVDAWQKRKLAAEAKLDADRLIVDYATAKPEEFLPDDAAFGTRPVRIGEPKFTTDAKRPIEKLFEFGAAEKDSIWNDLKIAPESQNDYGTLGGVVRSGRTIRTPSFELKDGKVHALVKGRGMLYAAMDAHVMIAGPLHGSLVHQFDTGDRWQWVTYDWASYKGHRLHLEFTSTADKEFSIRTVVQGGTAPANPENLLVELLGNLPTVAALAERLGERYVAAVKRFGDDAILGSPTAQADTVYVNSLLQSPGLVATATDKPTETARTFAALQEARIAQIKRTSRLAVAMQEGTGVDGKVFIRGSHKALGESVPRRLPEAIAGNGRITDGISSGRLELARQLVEPKSNPFVTRLYVNRIWHHLTGRGIVASVDNFGVMGELPTHPELLDFLASKFAADGWSTKKLIKEIVLSRFYGTDSKPTVESAKADVDNRLLSHMRIKRLEGETIRDAMLAISGRLDPKMYGPSVPLHLTEFLDGRGRPASSGPLDGAGRRSIYIAVRRNFLSPFMMAFDTPSPFSTVGKRTVSNVPAQALILMNDPFVHSQAQLWGQAVAASAGTPEERVRRMYETAFGRPPTAEESKRAVSFVAEQIKQSKKGEASVWGDLAHVLFNVKEFIFVN